VITRFVSGSALWLALLALPVMADESPDLGTILVVGQKDAPISIEPRGLSVSLGEEQFEAINALNVEDLMKYAPNFFVRKRFIGDNNASPGFRGTHSTQSARTIVMVDGFAISNFLGSGFGFSPKWGVVGPGEVQQFDIVYGPYSARFGGNSMGGIINITTRDPLETEAFATLQSFLQPYEQYGTDDSYFGWSAEAGFGWKQKDGPWSLRLSYRHFQNDGHVQQWNQLSGATGTAPAVEVTGAVIDPDTLSRIGADPAPIFAGSSPVATRHDQVRGKVGFDNGTVRAEAFMVYWWNREDESKPDCYLRDDAGNVVCEGRVRFQGRLFQASGANLVIRDKQDLLAGVKLSGDLAGWETRLNLSHFAVVSQRNRTSNGYVQGLANGTGTFTDQGPTNWWTLDLLTERSFGDVQLAFGVQANRYTTDQTRFNVSNWRERSNPSFALITQGQTRILGAFTEAEWQVNDAVALTAGVRVDNWRASEGLLAQQIAGQRRDQRFPEREKTAVSPSLSAQWSMGDGWSSQLSLAIATRFPTVNELFQGSFNSDGSFNPNSFDPALRPERSRDINLIVRKDWEGVSLTGSVYGQWVKDTIFSQQVFIRPGVFASSNRNIERTRQLGAELIASTQDALFEGLNLDVNVAYLDSKTVRSVLTPAAQGVQFPRIPRWRINANARYAVTETVQASLGWRRATRPNTNLEGTQRGDTFGYTSELSVFDARLTWAPTEHLQFGLGVDNITNARTWAFHPFPQRTFVADLKWKL
jgi:iron complex outermembrane recepter protein